MVEAANAVIALALQRRTKDDVTGGWVWMDGVGGSEGAACEGSRFLLWQGGMPHLPRPPTARRAPPRPPPNPRPALQRWWCGCGPPPSGAFARPPTTSTTATSRPLCPRIGAAPFFLGSPCVSYASPGSEALSSESSLLLCFTGLPLTLLSALAIASMDHVISVCPPRINKSGAFPSSVHLECQFSLLLTVPDTHPRILAPPEGRMLMQHADATCNDI